jgi:hypothetical protein
MNTTLILKYVSVAGSIFGVIASLSVVPGVSPTRSIAIIGAAAILYKICDIVENALKPTAPTPVTSTPTSSVKYP